MDFSEKDLVGTYARIGEKGPSHCCGVFPEDDDFLVSGDFEKHGRFGEDMPTACAGRGNESIVYLMDSGHFLQIAYWYGFEHAAAAGHWRAREDILQLHGVSKILMIDHPIPDTCERFAQDMVIAEEDGAPILGNSNGSGPSLLSFADRFAFLGHRHSVVLDSGSFPDSLKDVEPWISDFLDKNDPDKNDDDYWIHPGQGRVYIPKIV